LCAAYVNFVAEINMLCSLHLHADRGEKLISLLSSVKEMLQLIETAFLLRVRASLLHNGESETF
jgi:hypothetical protein